MSTREIPSNNGVDTENSFANEEMTIDRLQLSDNQDDTWITRTHFYSTYVASRIRETYSCIKTWSQAYNNKCKIIFFFNILCFLAIICAVAQLQSSKNISKQQNNEIAPDFPAAYQFNLSEKICASDNDCHSGLKCGYNHCHVQLASGIDFTINCCIKKLKEPCKEFELVSTGPAKKSRAYMGTMGTYILEDRLFNGRVLYHNLEKGMYLYWMKIHNGNWIVSSKPGNTIGFIQNTDCDDVECPADGDCINWWMYAKAAKWHEDNSIRLICKGSNMTIDYSDVLPSGHNNAISLKIWNPMYMSQSNNSTTYKEEQYKTYVAMLDTGNSMRYPLMTKRVYNELKSLNVIQNNENLSESYVSIKSINNVIYKPKTLILKKPLTFLTEVGTKVTLDRFYVQNSMPSDINIGKYKLSELGAKWDLKRNFVYFDDDKIPLKPYE